MVVISNIVIDTTVVNGVITNATEAILTIEPRDVIDGRIDHIDIRNIKRIHCKRCRITELPCWPNVTKVYCSGNQLTSLPLWTDVTFVDCSVNQLTVLPLWTNITTIECCHNQLIELPLWTNVIDIVCCHGNQFIYPPKISNTVMHINIIIGNKKFTDIVKYMNFYNKFYSQLIMINFKVLPQDLIKYMGEFIE